MTAGPTAQSRTDLSRFLNPRGVAVVGVSNDPGRIGGQGLSLLTDFGYTGGIYPVNPKYGDIKGLTCYPDLLSVPQPCDVALIALSAERVAGAIEQCGKAGIPFALVLAGGFSEVGEEGQSLQANLVATARRANVRMVGPNCLGILNLKDNARIGFGGTAQLKTLKPGPMAMVTQSGGFGFGVVAMAAYYGVGCNYAISSGNEADLNLLDWVADLIERPEVEIIVAFMEGIDDGRRLIEIGERALELGKPILAWKVGNTDVGSQAATSHSARMTSGYGLYRAAFKHGGMVEIRDVDELIDIAKAFLIRKLPAGNRVGVLTLSGGAGVLLADRCIEHGLALPPLSGATTEKLRKTLVSFASSNNPVDATAHGYNDNFASYGEAIRLVLADPNIDQVVARVPRGRAARPWSENLVEMLRGVDKPVILNWPSAPDDNGDVLAYLERNGVPCMLGAGRAARALAALTDFARKRRAFQQHAGRPFKRVVASQPLALPTGVRTLGEHRSKQLLKRYGVPVVKEVLLTPSELGKLESAPVSFPVAVKIESPDLPHKTEAGAVRLGIYSLARHQAGRAGHDRCGKTAQARRAHRRHPRPGDGLGPRGHRGGSQRCLLRSDGHFRPRRHLHGTPRGRDTPLCAVRRRSSARDDLRDQRCGVAQRLPRAPRARRHRARRYSGAGLPVDRRPCRPHRRDRREPSVRARERRGRGRRAHRAQGRPGQARLSHS